MAMTLGVYKEAGLQRAVKLFWPKQATQHMHSLLICIHVQEQLSPNVLKGRGTSESKVRETEK